MATLTPKLREVDSVEIISLVDNSVDFLSTVQRSGVRSFRRWTKERFGERWMKTHSRLPFAEHGFSMLIRILIGGKSKNILFDTGASSTAIVTNAKRMGLKLSKVDAIVLSHGHYDHFGGLSSAMKAVDKVNLPIIIHEDMPKIRGIADSDGTIRRYPEFPNEKQLSYAKLVKTKQPRVINDETILITGEIPRETSFEQGRANHKVQTNG